MKDLKVLCSEIENAADEAAGFILKESRVYNITETESKGLNNFVSYVDKTSEKMLIERLGKLIPEAGFIAEEGTSTKKRKEIQLGNRPSGWHNQFPTRGASIRSKYRIDEG